MAYEKFISSRGLQGQMFVTPYVTVNKGGMTFNRHAKEMIGDGFKYVVFYFDKETTKIGLWFWKDSCPGGYALIHYKDREVFSVNSKSFFKAYEIIEKIKKCNTRHFPLELEQDEENKKNDDFYCIQIKSPRGRPAIRKDK